MENKNLIKVGGLWINKSKENVQYLSGNWGPGVRLLVFKNSHKRPDSKDPDYNLFLAPNEVKEKKTDPDSDSNF
jgi:hypothetical protein